MTPTVFTEMKSELYLLCMIGMMMLGYKVKEGNLQLFTMKKIWLAYMYNFFDGSLHIV